MSAVPSIPDTYRDTICKMGQGADCCSFLLFDCSGNGFECAKGTKAEPVIRQRRLEGSMVSKGDNCPGYDPYTP